MIKCVVNGVDIFNPINGKLDDIINYFVEFYGEKYRQRITERINNTTFLFFGEIDENTKISTLSDLTNFYSFRLEGIRENFFKELGCKENSYIKSLNMDSFQLFTNSVNNIAQNKLSEISKENADNLFKFLDILGIIEYNGGALENLLVTLKEFKSLLADNEWRAEFIAKFNKAKSLWMLKYQREYLSVGLEKSKNENVIKAIEKSGQEINEYYKNQINEFFAGVIARVKSVSLEDVKQDKDINNYIDTFIDIIEKREEFITDYDKKDRIDLFKFMGIDHGDDYDAYMNDTFLIKLLKSPEILDKYYELSDTQLNNQAAYCAYLDEAYKDLKNSGVPLSDNLARSMFRTFVGRDNNLGWATTIKYSGSSIPKFVCACKNYLKLDTPTFIHEVNHILESDYIFHCGEFVGYKSGISYTLTNGQRADNDVLNEVINDYITYQTYDVFKRHNYEVGSREPIESEYSKMFIILGEFLENNLELIKRCRMSESPNLFAQIIGLNNYNMLNNAMKDCYFLSEKEILAATKEINAKEKNNFKEPLSKNATILYNAFVTVDKVTENVKRKVNLDFIKN